MKTIYKYDLEITDSQILELPAGAEILTVQMQHDVPRLWAVVDVAPQGTTGVERRKIAVYSTGHAMRAGHHHYISTVQMRQGSLVFHIFEVGDRAKKGPSWKA